MSVKELAIRDIKKSLKERGRSFIAFRKELNPVMDSLVEEQLEEQQHISWCLSSYSKKINYVQ